MQISTRNSVAIRVGSIVRLAPGKSGGVLSNHDSRGRVIVNDGTSRPYKVQTLDGSIDASSGSSTSWYAADDVVLVDPSEEATTAVMAVRTCLLRLFFVRRC